MKKIIIDSIAHSESLAARNLHSLCTFLETYHIDPTSGEITIPKADFRYTVAKPFRPGVVKLFNAKWKDKEVIFSYIYKTAGSSAYTPTGQGAYISTQSDAVKEFYLPNNKEFLALFESYDSGHMRNVWNKILAETGDKYFKIVKNPVSCVSKSIQESRLIKLYTLPDQGSIGTATGRYAFDEKGKVYIEMIPIINDEIYGLDQLDTPYGSLRKKADPSNLNPEVYYDTWSIVDGPHMDNKPSVLWVRLTTSLGIENVETLHIPGVTPEPESDTIIPSTTKTLTAAGIALLALKLINN